MASRILEKNIVPRIETQIPEHIREDYPVFLAFLKAYYEYLGSDSNAMAASRRLPEDVDIDTTLEKFIEYFKKEFLVSLPKNVRADRRLLLKHAREFYRTRGSESSYKFLFRALFDDEIEFYYPGGDILRASDGRYEITKSIKLANISGGTAEDFDGVLVIGQSSGARARVTSFLGGEVSGVPIVELKVSNIQGVFQDGEQVKSEDGVITGDILNTIGPIATIANIRIPGAFHSSGDVVQLLDSGNGLGANGYVGSINDQSAVYFTISNGGSGYRANSIVTIQHSGGALANFRIDAINLPETLAGLNTDRITPFANIPLNVGGTNTAWRGYPGANTAAMGALFSVTNVNSTFNDAFSYATINTGSIKTITTTDFGYGYTTLPTASINDTFVESFKVASTANPGRFKGGDAEITVNRAPGSIESIVVNTQGQDYSKFRDVTITNQTKGAATGGYVSDKVLGNTPPSTAQSGTGEPGIFGIIDNPGVFTDTKGFLSWNNKIQDNFFYQEYSYALKTTENANSFRDIVKKLLHPAGTKMFNLYQITPEISAAPLGSDDGETTIRFAPVFKFESVIDVHAGIYTDEQLDGSVADDVIIPELLRNYALATGGSNGEIVIEPPVVTMGYNNAGYSYLTFHIDTSGTTIIPTISDEREIEEELVTDNVINLGAPAVETFIRNTLLIEDANTPAVDVLYSNSELGFFGSNWTENKATGTMFNRTDAQIQTYLSSTPNAADLGNIEIGAIGGAKLVYGNNTIFTSEFTTGQAFIIVSNTTNSTLSTGTANNIAFANVVFSNTVMSISSGYPYYPMSNTEFFTRT
jgi:hypothetical protein